MSCWWFHYFWDLIVVFFYFCVTFLSIWMPNYSKNVIYILFWYFGGFKIVKNEGRKKSHKNTRKKQRQQYLVNYSDKWGFRGQNLWFWGPNPYRPRHLSVKMRVLENMKNNVNNREKTASRFCRKNTVKLRFRRSKQVKSDVFGSKLIPNQAFYR